MNSPSGHQTTKRRLCPDVLVPKLCLGTLLLTKLRFAGWIPKATELPGQLRSQAEFGNENKIIIPCSCHPELVEGSLESPLATERARGGEGLSRAMSPPDSLGAADS